jgi:transposase-like protein
MGQVQATLVGEGPEPATLMPHITRRVMPEGVVYTDEWQADNQVGKSGYPYRRIHHGAGVYVMGTVHTNTIEGFWSLVKRGISGVHHAVSAKYLQGYLNEYAWRYNHRNDTTPLFRTLLENVRRDPALGRSPS